MQLPALPASFTNTPIDWILIAAFAGLVALDVVRSDSSRASALALALPAAYLLFQVLPTAFGIQALLTQFSGSKVEGIIFLGILVITWVVIRRVIGATFDSSGAFAVILIGVSTAVIGTVIWLSTPALAAIWDFGPQIDQVFANSYRFWLLAGAYGALAFARS